MALMVGSTLALAAPAFAADVIEEQVYDWSGLYAGVFAGVGYTSSDWDGTDDDITFDPVDIDTSLNDTALLLGGLIGVNFQHDNVVFGLEGDIAWFDSDKDKHLDGAEGLDLESQIEWLGSVRGRLGWADDRTLFYVTGGLAFADAEHTWDDGGSPSFNMPSKSVDLDFGWVAGLGIEHAWTDNILFRIEGFYFDLGSENGKVSGNGETDKFDVDQEIWVGRIGVSYKFN
jgi:outer membrane immunogenic protein